MKCRLFPLGAGNCEEQVGRALQMKTGWMMVDTVGWYNSGEGSRVHFGRGPQVSADRAARLNIVWERQQALTNLRRELRVALRADDVRSLDQVAGLEAKIAEAERACAPPEAVTSDQVAMWRQEYARKIAARKIAAQEGK